MKKTIRLAVLGLLCAVLPCARAVFYTNYLNEASNAIAQVYAATTDVPDAARTHKLLGKALKDLGKPSTSVAGDYGIFVSVSGRLLPLVGTAGTEAISATLSNAFVSFLLEAYAESLVLSDRIGAITPFQRQRRAASNQVSQAQQALERVATSADIKAAIIALRLAYVKLTVGAKLVAKAEARQGFAPNLLTGLAFHHHVRAKDGPEEGTVNFTSGSEFSDGADSGTYEYERTGLNSGRFVLHAGDGGTTTVTFVFTSATAGRFGFEFVDSTDSGKGRGTFSTEGH